MTSSRKVYEEQERRHLRDIAARIPGADEVFRDWLLEQGQSHESVMTDVPAGTILEPITYAREEPVFYTKTNDMGEVVRYRATAPLALPRQLITRLSCAVDHDELTEGRLAETTGYPFGGIAWISKVESVDGRFIRYHFSVLDGASKFYLLAIVPIKS